MKQVYLTKEGIEALKQEVEKLMDEKRPAMVKRVAKARDMGDLSENAEYASAREELAIMDGRIEELETILNKAQLIKGKVKKGKLTEVKLGCKVTVRVGRTTYVYNVVGEWEADPANKKISHSSPLGKALLGRKKGDKVEIEAPVGKMVYHIVKIH